LVFKEHSPVHPDNGIPLQTTEGFSSPGRRPETPVRIRDNPSLIVIFFDPEPCGSFPSLAKAEGNGRMFLQAS
jgi:hypothetical protein